MTLVGRRHTGPNEPTSVRTASELNALKKSTFTSIFPGCYAGRWPHIHFEVYPSLSAAGSVSNKVATSQIALPKSACDLTYATSGYAGSSGNLSQVSLATDNVFSDGSALELATVSGSVASGFTATMRQPSRYSSAKCRSRTWPRRSCKT